MRARRSSHPRVGLAVVLSAVGAAACDLPLPIVVDHPWPRHTIDDASRGADGVRLADMNGDGRLDITTPWEEGDQVRIYLHPKASATSTRWPGVTVGRVGAPEDAVFVDLDADGAVDVVSSCEGSDRTVYVHWAPKQPDRILDPAAWTTEPIPATRKARAWMFCVPLRSNGQPTFDLIVGAKGDNAQIGRLQAPANPRDLAAWSYHTLAPAGWIMSLILHDVDGDGDRDLVVSDRKGDHRGCFWLENPGPPARQRLPWTRHAIGGEDKEVMFLTTADLDRDGLTDVLATVRGKEILFFRRETADGRRWRTYTIQIPASAGTGKGIAVGDIDRDDRPDIVFSCENAGDGKTGVMWMSYRRSPTEPLWTAHDISGSAGIKFDLVALIDLDGDGDLDVLTCEERDNLGVIWYKNPTLR